MGLKKQLLCGFGTRFISLQDVVCVLRNRQNCSGAKAEERNTRGPV